MTTNKDFSFSIRTTLPSISIDGYIESYSDLSFEKVNFSVLGVYITGIDGVLALLKEIRHLNQFKDMYESNPLPLKDRLEGTLTYKLDKVTLLKDKEEWWLILNNTRMSMSTKNKWVLYDKLKDFLQKIEDIKNNLQ